MLEPDADRARGSPSPSARPAARASWPRRPEPRLHPGRAAGPRVRRRRVGGGRRHLRPLLPPQARPRRRSARCAAWATGSGRRELRAGDWRARAVTWSSCARPRGGSACRPRPSWPPTVLLMAAFGAGPRRRRAEQRCRRTCCVRPRSRRTTPATRRPAPGWCCGTNAACASHRGCPPACPTLRAMDTVARTGRTQLQVVHVGPRDYLVRTIRRGSTTVQALLDLTAQHRQRAALARVLAEVGSSAWPCRRSRGRCWHAGRSARCRTPWPSSARSSRTPATSCARR